MLSLLAAELGKKVTKKEGAIRYKYFSKLLLSQ